MSGMAAEIDSVTGLPLTRGGSPFAIPEVKPIDKSVQERFMEDPSMTGIGPEVATPLSTADIAASTSPFADPMKQAAGRASQAQGGLGSLSGNPLSGGAFGSILSMLKGNRDFGPATTPIEAVTTPPTEDPRIFPTPPARPSNPFEGNEQYQALMDFQKSLAPSQEQQQQLQDLRTAFEGTGAFKDYRINQLQNRLQQSPMMGRGLGMARPTGMGMFGGFPMRQPMQQPMFGGGGFGGGFNRGFGGGFGGGFGMQPMQQPMRQFGAFGFNQPQQQQQPNFYSGYGGMQQQMPMQQQPQFGGYNQYQQMGSGYGGYGGMPNMYQPQQMGAQQMQMGATHRGMNQFGGFG